MTLGERIKKLRKEMGLSLGKLSEASGISNAYLCQLETGKSKDPSLSKARQLASALNTTIGYLFDGTEVKVFCGNCRFCIESECHRYPPQVIGTEAEDWFDGEKLSDSFSIWGYPSVSRDTDWCGEWKPKVDA